MTRPARPGDCGSSRFRFLNAITFFALLAYWTYLLLKPNPVPESLLPEFSWFDREMLIFLLAKALHLSGYAVLTILGASAVPRGRWRVMVTTFMIVHGVASELGQWAGNRYYGTNRYGCVRDAIIDTAGVAVGAGMLWWWERRQTKHDNR